MEVTLYSTGCPKCKVLEAKLKQKNVTYQEINDIDVMTEKGFLTVPVLEINGTIMNFIEANTWINERN